MSTQGSTSSGRLDGRGDDWIAELIALSERYGDSVPRYTSYPTAPSWSDDFGAVDHRRALAECRGAPALYVHVPFCRSLCHYCACNKVITRKPELPARYLDAIEVEVGAVRDLVPAPEPAPQLHWGGGTPTHLTPDQVERLHRTVTDAFPLAEGAEVSIEVDPRVTTPEHVATLRACGFNRMSLGVQDFDERVQRAISREQSFAQTRSLLEQARHAGFASVGFDLIYGLPFQTAESFGRTLDRVLELSPDRIALYSYAHVTWVAKQQRSFERVDLPAPETKLRIFALAISRLGENGYEPIGLDHFARTADPLARARRDGSLRRNFMGYTTQPGEALLAFGPSAISELPAAFVQNQRDLDAWQDAVAQGGLATLRGHVFSAEDRIRRAVIEQIMCHGRMDPATFAPVLDEPFEEHFAAELRHVEALERDGLVSGCEGGGFLLSDMGRLLSRHVAATFDAYLARQRASSSPMFSRAI